MDAAWKDQPLTNESWMVSHQKIFQWGKPDIIKSNTVKWIYPTSVAMQCSAFDTLSLLSHYNPQTLLTKALKNLSLSCNEICISFFRNHKCDYVLLNAWKRWFMQSFNTVKVIKVSYTANISKACNLNLRFYTCLYIYINACYVV